MSKHSRCVLTATDYAILRSMLAAMAEHSVVIASVLREKLASATIVTRDKVDPRIVTLNSRVLFRVNDGLIQSRVVIHDDKRRVDGLTIPINVPRGLALMGLTESQEFILRGPGRATEKLQVIEVAYQPEATERSVATSQFFTEPLSGSSTGEIVPFKSRRQLDSWPLRPRVSDDDSDPPAA
jgi:regulator of nucleoside diphosphate kinase